MSASSRSIALQHLLVAFVALAWGLSGRLALDWLLPHLGLSESPSQPTLTFAIGPTWVWALIAAALWTPLTVPLSRATPQRAMVLGFLVTVAGTLVLYPFFVLRMGLPRSLEELAGVFMFFPLFAASALAFGGFVAVPIAVATALLFRRLLTLRSAKSTTGGGA